MSSDLTKLKSLCEVIERKRPKRQEFAGKSKTWRVYWEMSRGVEAAIVELINEARRLVDAAEREDGG